MVGFVNVLCILKLIVLVMLLCVLMSLSWCWFGYGSYVM